MLEKFDSHIQIMFTEEAFFSSLNSNHLYTLKLLFYFYYCRAYINCYGFYSARTYRQTFSRPLVEAPRAKKLLGMDFMESDTARMENESQIVESFIYSVSKTLKLNWTMYGYSCVSAESMHSLHEVREIGKKAIH